MQRRVFMPFLIKIKHCATLVSHDRWAVKILNSPLSLVILLLSGFIVLFSFKHYKNIPVSVTYGTTSVALGCTWAGYRTLGERVDVLGMLSFSFTILVPIPYVGRLWGWCLVCDMRWNRCTKVWGFILPECPLSAIMWRCTMSLVQAEPFLKAPEKNGFQKMVPFHLVMTMEKSRTSGKMLWIALHSWLVNTYLVSLPFWMPGRLSSVLFVLSRAMCKWTDACGFLCT